MCDMTLCYARYGAVPCVMWCMHIRIEWCILACDITSPSTWHDASQRLASLISMCDTPHSCVWHGPYLRVKWLMTWLIRDGFQYIIGDLERPRAAVVYMSHVTWICLVICDYAMSHINQSCHIRTKGRVLLWYTQIMSRMDKWMSQLAFKWVMCHTWIEISALCHLSRCLWDMTHSYVTWLIPIFDMTPSCVTWLILICDMTQCVDVCAGPSQPLPVWHDPFIHDTTHSCVTCHILICDMTHCVKGLWGGFD